MNAAHKYALNALGNLLVVGCLVLLGLWCMITWPKTFLCTLCICALVNYYVSCVQKYNSDQETDKTLELARARLQQLEEDWNKQNDKQ